MDLSSNLTHRQLTVSEAVQPVVRTDYFTHGDEHIFMCRNDRIQNDKILKNKLRIHYGHRIRSVITVAHCRFGIGRYQDVIDFIRYSKRE